MAARELLARSAKFPLRDKLIAAGPSPLSGPDLTIFEAVAVPGVDRDKLAYFGVSVFWRAAVHHWHLPSGDPGPIQLGPYEAPTRRYLLGETDFPKDVVLLVSVAHSTEEMKNKFVTFLWCFKREGGHHQFKLIVPGTTFQMCVGKTMQPGLRNMCTARSSEGFIYMSSRTDDINVQGNLAMLKTAKRVGKLATRPHSPTASRPSDQATTRSRSRLREGDDPKKRGAHRCAGQRVGYALRPGLLSRDECGHCANRDPGQSARARVKRNLSVFKDFRLIPAAFTQSRPGEALREQGVHLWSDAKSVSRWRHVIERSSNPTDVMLIDEVADAVKITPKQIRRLERAR